MANFKTAYLQAAFPHDVEVVGTVNEGVQVTKDNRKAAICRNDFVILTAATATVNAYIKKATESDVASKKATHLVALTDMTMGNGHAKSEIADYRVSELTGATRAAAPTDKTGTLKKVALYPIWDWNDIIPDADKNDCATNT